MAFTVKNISGGFLGFGPYTLAKGARMSVDVLDKHIHAAAVAGKVSVTNAASFTSLTSGANLVTTAIDAYIAGNGTLINPGGTYTQSEMRTNFATLAAHNKKLEVMLMSLIASLSMKNID